MQSGKIAAIANSTQKMEKKRSLALLDFSTDLVSMNK